MIQLALLLLAAAPPSLNYSIKPIPVSGRTDVEITFASRLGAGEHKILLPMDYYTTPELHKYVVSFEGLEGTVVKPGEKADERRVSANADGWVRLRYALRYDPVELESSAFGPNTSKEHLHLAGCHWMLRVGDLKQKREVSIRMLQPKGWTLYSNLTSEPEMLKVNASYEGLITSIVGGGSRPHGIFELRGKPVKIFIQGEYSFDTRAMTEMVRKVVVSQREWFEDYDFPFYTVAISEKPNIIAGTCIDNAFVCFAKEEITQDELLVLLAHEMFHTWLPGKIRTTVPNESEEGRIRMNWFDEGFTDYFARLMLLEDGLISKDRFVELFNKDLRNLADNAQRNATFASQVEDSKNGRFTNVHQKLAYYRGAVIAAGWEARARKQNKTLKDMMRELYRLSKSQRYSLSHQELFAIAERYVPGTEAEWERYIMKGETIQPEAAAMGSEFELRQVMIPPFEPGFALQATYASRKVEGVVEGSEAWKAGLRNGMEFVSGSNLNRFSNAWSAERKAVVVVRDGGVEKRIEYYPVGAPLPLPQWVKR